MKENILTCLTFVVLIPSVSIAQNTYWVSNDPSDLEVVQFSNLQTAINSSASGDTLMIYPTGINYGNIVIDKEIHLEGIGYRSDTVNQPGLTIETIQFSASVGSINVENDADESTLKGIYAANLQLQYVDGFTVSYCYIEAIRVDNSADIAIIANYIGSSFFSYGGCGFVFNVGIVSSQNVLLFNNIFSDFFNHFQCFNDRRNLYVEANSGNVLIKNNIFNDYVQVNNSLLINNIFINTSVDYNNCVFDFNIFDGNISNNPSGNLYNVLQTSLFVGYPNQLNYSFDSRYQLLPASPAREYGINGEDCGVFDGDYPYQLSGITNRPIISELEVPLSTYGDEMHITVRAKIIH